MHRHMLIGKPADVCGLICVLVQRFPGMTPMLEGVVDNYNMWKETEVPPVAAQ